MNDLEVRLRRQLRELSDLRPTPTDLGDRLNARIGPRPASSSRGRRVLQLAAAAAMAVLALMTTIAIQADDTTVKTVNPADTSRGQVEPSEIVTPPGSPLQRPTDDTTPWASQAAVRPCPAVLARVGIASERGDEILGALGPRGEAVCSFQTPDITTVGPDALVLEDADTAELEVEVVFVPDGLDVERDNWLQIQRAGGALLTISPTRPGQPDPRLESNPGNATGGWLVYEGGVPTVRSMLSRPATQRYALSWVETPEVGPDLSVWVFVDSDVDGLVDQLRVTQSAAPDTVDDQVDAPTEP